MPRNNEKNSYSSKVICIALEFVKNEKIKAGYCNEP